MKEVVVYTTSPCPYCTRAKELLSRRGVPFREILYRYDEEEKWDELEKRSGMKSMPQIFHGERLIGGYTELAELDATDKLLSLKS